MPLYEYKCGKCGASFEKLLPISRGGESQPCCCRRTELSSQASCVCGEGCYNWPCPGPPWPRGPRRQKPAQEYQPPIMARKDQRMDSENSSADPRLLGPPWLTVESALYIGLVLVGAVLRFWALGSQPLQERAVEMRFGVVIRPAQRQPSHHRVVAGHHHTPPVWQRDKPVGSRSKPADANVQHLLCPQVHQATEFTLDVSKFPQEPLYQQ